MKKMLLMSTALLTLASGASMAADLSRPPPAAPVYTKAPPMMTLFTWTGCYVGGNGGGVWATKDVTDTATGLSLGSISVSGGIAGAQVGCNYQFAGNWVIGAQGDFDWSGASGSINDVFAFTDTVKIKSLASATGRVGYAFDRFLAYVKGGGAWETDDYSSTGPGVSVTLSDTRSGWTIGGGGEYAFTDWLTGFVEYDYYDFGTATENLTGTGGPLALNVKETKSVAKAGLNFKFGGWH